ncbi:MAG: branched-chain amino acid ABC transporter permease [Nocardioides sp.]
MSELLESVLRGLGQGSVYALLAIGFVIIYKSSSVISFAQPAMMLSGAVIVSYLSPSVGFFAALGLGAVAMAGVGLGVERVFIRPMVGRPVFVIAIITIGLDIAIRVIANGFIGLGARPIGDPWGLSRFEVAGVAMQWRHVAMIITTAIVLAALYLFFRFTRHGLAMRATAFDQEAALTQGVSVGSVFAMSWAMAAGIAAIAGALLATGAGVDRQLWIVTLVALPAIILGGLDSLEGAVVGGLAVGLVESLVGTYQGDLAPWLGNNFESVSAYALMLLVLLVRPYGIWGTPEVKRV